MRKFALWWTAWCVMQSIVALADVDPWNYAFQLSAQAVASPASITLLWPQKNVPQISVRRKLPTDSGWGATTTLPGNATSFTDTGVQPGQAYEYEVQGVVQDDPQQIAYGYICAGSIIPPVEQRGKVMLVVDNRFAGPLSDELATLRKDLIGDGWTVIRQDVSSYGAPPDVKALIRNEYNADPSNMRAVFLIGHVPVPYSGMINPDMHLNHLGAWPADAYYGDMNGNWTDTSVYKTDAEFSWNDNVPGDGKFDQSTIPGQVELEVGRVDFYDMPSFLPRGETDLLRNYLDKDHAFRHRTMSAPLRGLIRDNFGTIAGDAPAVDAWRAFPALFGQGQFDQAPAGQVFSTLENNPYLFTYACGGGDFDKEDGMGTTTDFVNNDPKTVFFLLHGSYFGDWNNTDNFLRAAIATPSMTLVSIWASLPHWYFHPLALGETIGYVTRLNQNNQNGLYRNDEDLSNGQVHISMLGDPTLRAFPLAPPSNVQISVTDKINFTWNPAWQEVDGYHIYYGPSYDGPFQRATRRAVATTSYSMPMLAAGHYVFMLKSAAIQTTGSGSFNNLSQGIFIEADVNGAVSLPTVNISATDDTGDENDDPIVFTLTRTSPIDSALDVSVQYSGTATAGQDYQASATVSFEAGSPTVTLTIVPTQDSINEEDESIVVTLQPSSSYHLGKDTAATGTIKGSGQSEISIATISPVGSFNLTATGFANSPYRIEARTPTGAWTTKTNGIASADGSISFRESATANSQCLFYRVVWP